MTKRPVIVVGFVLLVALAGCGSQKAAAATVAPEADALLPSNYDNALPPMEQLAVGTFRLEGHPEAVTADQAKQLAFLWRGYRALTTSDTTSPQELAGLQKQLEDAMTPEQLQAIRAMHLTRQDLMTLLNQQGVQAGNGRAGNSSTSSQSSAGRSQGSTSRGSRGEGGPPAGGFGGGFFPGGFAGGGSIPAEQQTLIAQRASGGAGGSAVPSALLDKLIALLDSKK